MRLADKLNFRKTYAEHIRRVKNEYRQDTAMEVAIGGEFKAFGILMRELLIQVGLKKDDYVIDVGCGSGRLAKPLSEYLSGKYLGIDVVPDLVTYAGNLVKRPDWRFEVTKGFSIPEKNNRANMVCFFSVFTHLLHEESYRYLEEAKRVLKPSGKIVFSFLEFSIPCHWNVFEANLKNMGKPGHLNMFMSRGGINAWAEHLDLNIETIEDGDKPHIPLSSPVTLDNNKVMQDKGNLGQSICVLSLK